MQMKASRRSKRVQFPYWRDDVRLANFQSSPSQYAVELVLKKSLLNLARETEGIFFIFVTVQYYHFYIKITN